MCIDVAVRLIGCVTIVIGFAVAYWCGRADERKQTRLEEGQKRDGSIQMDHEHGGDSD